MRTCVGFNDDGIHLNMHRLKKEFDFILEYYSSIKLKIDPPQNMIEDDYGQLTVRLKYLKSQLEECIIQSNIIAEWKCKPE